MKYPRKISLTVHMHNGSIISSLPIEIADEKEEAHWATVLRSPKKLDYLAISEAAALGGENSIYINPTYISHIYVSDVQE